MYSIVNGKTVAAPEAAVSVADRGFRYGDGLFETVAVHGGLPWRFDWHLARLARGLTAVRIAYDAASLKAPCLELLKKNNVGDGILRIQVTRGLGGRGYLPDADAKPTVVIETAPMPQIPFQPVALALSSYRKVSAAALPVQHKLAQGLNSTLVRMEAAEQQCAEGLLLNEQEEICETGSSNIFWLAHGTLFTPDLSCGVLDGSARAAVIELSPWPVREVSARLAALKEAEAVFITNVVMKALPVAEIGGQGMLWNSGPAAEKIYNLLLNNTKKS